MTAVMAQLKEVENIVLRYVLKKMRLKIICVEEKISIFNYKCDRWLYLTEYATNDFKIDKLKDDKGHISQLKAQYLLRDMFMWNASIEKSNHVIRGKDEEELLNMLQKTDKMLYYPNGGTKKEFVDSYPFNKSIEEIMIELDLYGESKVQWTM